MTILLTAIAILLLAISVWQISKIFEVSNLGVKRDESQIASDKDNDMQGKLMFLFLAFIYVVTIYSFASLQKFYFLNLLLNMDTHMIHYCGYHLL